MKLEKQKTGNEEDILALINSFHNLPANISSSQISYSFNSKKQNNNKLNWLSGFTGDYMRDCVLARHSDFLESLLAAWQPRGADALSTQLIRKDLEAD